jgi:hypothetical protein
MARRRQFAHSRMKAKRSRHVYDESLLSIHTPEVLERIQRQDPTWEAMVPAVVAEAIKTKNLFGLKSNS